MLSDMFSGATFYFYMASDHNCGKRLHNWNGVFIQPTVTSYGRWCLGMGCSYNQQLRPMVGGAWVWISSRRTQQGVTYLPIPESAIPNYGITLVNRVYYVSSPTFPVRQASF